MRLAGSGALGLTFPNYINTFPLANEGNISHEPIEWKYLTEGLEFSKTGIYKNKKLIDVITSVKIDPEKNKIRVFNGNTGDKVEIYSIKDWQNKTGALAIINGNQYMKNPEYYPCGLVICDGNQIGPKHNQYSKGMLVAEPRNFGKKLKKADLLDFDYDEFDYKTTPYTQGVQHWPILLNREGKIRVNESDLEANRTIIAKTKDDKILFMTTEDTYFTLYNLGKFFKESNGRTDNGYNIHTAMNLDGGPTSGMIVKSPKLEYSNNAQVKIPGIIGVFSRY